LDDSRAFYNCIQESLKINESGPTVHAANGASGRPRVCRTAHVQNRHVGHLVVRRSAIRENGVPRGVGKNYRMRGWVKLSWVLERD